jgi:hypothetical protein
LRRLARAVARRDVASYVFVGPRRRVARGRHDCCRTAKRGSRRDRDPRRPSPRAVPSPWEPADDRWTMS